MEWHILNLIILSCSLEGIFGQVEVSPENLNLFLGESGSINCTVQAEDQVTWADTTTQPSVPILFGTVGTNNIERGPDAGTGTKYENFDIESPEGSTQFNLKITEAQFNEDEGTYECQVFSVSPAAGHLSIAVLPPIVDINCTLTDCFGTDGISHNDVTCNCSATGVFPQDLEIMWDGVMGSPKTKRISSTTGPSGTFDLRSEAVVQQVDGAETVSCTLSGYAKDPGSRGKSVTLVSPTCSLQEPPNKVCSEAVFTCIVENEPYPEDISFHFFYGNGTQLQSGQKDEIQLDIEKGSTIELYCIVCNSFGSHQSDIVSYECPSVEPTPSATTPNKTGDADPGTTDSNGVVIGLSVVGSLIAVAVIVIIIIFVLKRWKNPTERKNAVTATTGDTTSNAPVYGVIDKSKKKKSDKTDDNGMPMSEAPEYAAVDKPLKSEPKPAPRSSQLPPNNSTEKQELQYADIDHSNRTPSNQIRQPAEAPTEYATVQSVIV